MPQARVGDEGIKERQRKIASWESQISVWESMKEKSRGLTIMREAVQKGVSTVEKEILERVKTLSFATEADRLDLAKMSGRLDAYQSVYYDIADADKKIEGARLIIAKLLEEIKRAKKGELLERA